MPATLKTSLCLVASLTGAPAFAAPAGQPLTLAACYAEAVARNPTLAAARAALDRSAFDVDASKAGLYPQISASVDATRALTSGGGDRQGFASQLDTAALPSSSSDEAALKWHPAGDFGAGIDLRQSLYDGGRTRATLARRGAELEGARASLDVTALQLVYDLGASFYQNLYYQQLDALQGRVAARRRENVRLVSLRFDGGRENKGAVAKSTATMHQAEADLAAAGRQLAVARGQLARLLGRTPDAGAPGAVAGDFTLPDLPPPLPSQAATLPTPARRQASANVQAAKAALNAAYSERLPQVAATASARRSGDWPPQTNRLAVGVSVSVPLYSGGLEAADIRGAGADVARAEAQALSADADAAQSLASTRAALVDAVQSVGLRKELLDATSLQAEIARNQYSLGLISFQDWDLIETQLIDAERALLGSRRDATLAATDWAKAQGILPSALRGATP